MVFVFLVARISNFIQMLSFAFWWMLAFGLIYLLFIGMLLLIKASLNSLSRIAFNV